MRIFPENISPRDARRGFTLVELLVTVGLGVAVIAVVTMTLITLSNSMFAIANYNDLDKHSAHTLDLLSRDIRNAASVGSDCTTNNLTLTNSFYNIVINYKWDGTNYLLRTSTSNGVVVVDTNLLNCDYFNFAYAQRNPTNANAAGMYFYPTTSPNQIKLVSLSWRCSRKILGVKLNTESVQTAQVTIRN